MPRLDRNAWMAGAWAMLDAHPDGGLSVERLARRLGVTRGSFYHHFSGRQEFVRALLRHWEDTYTTAVIERARGADSAPAVLQRYLEATAMLQPGREVALRRWAASERIVAETLHRVDMARMDFIRAVAQRLLPEAPAAVVERMTRMGFLAFIGMQQSGRHGAHSLRELVDDWQFLAVTAAGAGEGSIA